MPHHAAHESILICVNVLRTLWQWEHWSLQWPDRDNNFLFTSQFSHPTVWKKICRTLCEPRSLTERSPEFSVEAHGTPSRKRASCAGLGFELWRVLHSSKAKQGNNDTDTGRVPPRAVGGDLCYGIADHTVTHVLTQYLLFLTELYTYLCLFLIRCLIYLYK